ncbi:MAG: hypothetical protein Q7U44_08225, partial [Desulfuromonadales bacterium]|nr:hypothetical protein [Desulfuromonadales bacterium]
FGGGVAGLGVGFQKAQEHDQCHPPAPATPYGNCSDLLYDICTRCFLSDHLFVLQTRDSLSGKIPWNNLTKNIPQSNKLII